MRLCGNGGNCISDVGVMVSGLGDDWGEMPLPLCGAHPFMPLLPAGVVIVLGRNLSSIILRF